MIKLDEKKLEQINDTFSKLDNLAKNEALLKLADDTYERAFNYADKHTKSGELITSMYYKKVDNGYKIGFDNTKAPYANFVHFGSKAHTIKLKDKKALRWVSNGKFTFAKKVNHPGYKGDEFLYNALSDELVEFSRWIDDRIDDIV